MGSILNTFVLFITFVSVGSKNVNNLISDLKLETGLLFRLQCTVDKAKSPTFNMRVTFYNVNHSVLLNTRLTSVNGWGKLCSNHKGGKPFCAETGELAPIADKVVFIEYLDDGSKITFGSIGMKGSIVSQFVVERDVKEIRIEASEINLVSCNDKVL